VTDYTHVLRDAAKLIREHGLLPEDLPARADLDGLTLDDALQRAAPDAGVAAVVHEVLHRYVRPSLGNIESSTLLVLENETATSHDLYDVFGVKHEHVLRIIRRTGRITLAQARAWPDELKPGEGWWNDSFGRDARPWPARRVAHVDAAISATARTAAAVTGGWGEPELARAVAAAAQNADAAAAAYDLVHSSRVTRLMSPWTSLNAHTVQD
jgi:hypothetical protein